jgi:HK97 family phage major capsid protein
MENELLTQFKAWSTGFDGKFTQLSDQIASVQKQADAIDEKMQKSIIVGGGRGGGKDLASEVFDSAEFKSFAQTGRGRIAVSIPDFQRKTAILNSTLGYSTPGVVGSERVGGGIVPAAMNTFRVRDLMRTIPTESGMVDFLRATYYSPASPIAEGELKDEANLAFEDVSEKMKCLAHWVPVSRQALQDVSQLRESIDTHLLAGLYDGEDSQLLNGDGSGENLHGLCHLASSFDTSLLIASDGFEYADCLGWAIAQLQNAKRRASGLVLNPLDFWKIRLAKTSTGEYIFGNPTRDSFTQLWGLPAAITNAMVQGTFLVGAFSTGCALFVRLDGTIEVSDSHSDYFVRNKLAVRCEMRELLATYTPDAFVTGSFEQSPV